MIDRIDSSIGDLLALRIAIARRVQRYRSGERDMAREARILSRLDDRRSLRSYDVEAIWRPIFEASLTKPEDPPEIDE